MENTKTTTTVFLCPRGCEGSTKSGSTSHGRHTQGGKRHPQHKVVRKTICGEDSKYRCVVKIVFPKTRIYKKKAYVIKKTKLLQRCSWARGGCVGRIGAVPSVTVDTLRGGRTGYPQHKVVKKKR